MPSDDFKTACDQWVMYVSIVIYFFVLDIDCT